MASEPMFEQQPREYVRNSIDFSELASVFHKSQPFRHVVVERFLGETALSELQAAFPRPGADIWHAYDNPLEKKRTCNDLARLPGAFVDVLRHLNSAEFVARLVALTGIAGLRSDPEYFGGGVHCVLAGGKLDIHVDHSLHPKTGLERRLNLIIYLNDEWRPEWGGSLQLWRGLPGSPVECAKQIVPEGNRAVLFEAHDRSFHGHPDPLCCPAQQSRKSLAVYYFAPPRPTASDRRRAQYFARPDDQPDPELDRLRKMRAHSDTAAFVYVTKKSKIES
jgi:Rps23 Pro-64 3,4-dihydroxylase Tpa1-like proline 4-hydroxylase